MISRSFLVLPKSLANFASIEFARNMNNYKNDIAFKLQRLMVYIKGFYHFHYKPSSFLLNTQIIKHYSEYSLF